MSTVFVDVDTQLDFLYPGGGLYVPGAERIVPAIERLNRYAAAHGMTVLSTTDAHTENDPEFTKWPPHCVAGAIGQHKPAATLLDRRAVVPNLDCGLSLEGAQQIILEKQTVDVFEARQLRRVLETLNAKDFVVYGVATEICVWNAVRGLLALKRPVTVVAEAVKELAAADGARVFDQIRALGGVISTLDGVCRN
ncbi:MAG: cysteine hydrolase [Acidobacteriia bacterium]|nr:cysteine hydrolase [Terriglobia bacterium]